MRDVLNGIRWPGALVILGVLALVGFMFWRGATLEALLGIVVALLGYQQQQRAQDSQRLQQVESNTNGANTALRAQIDQMQAERAQDLKIMAALASRLPVGTVLPPALEQAGMLPLDAPVSPAAAYANGATAPLPRTPYEP